MTISFNHRALARSLGSSDPDLIEAAADLITGGDFVLRFPEVTSDEDPAMELAEATDEVDRLTAKYLVSSTGGVKDIRRRSRSQPRRIQ